MKTTKKAATDPLPNASSTELKVEARAPTVPLVKRLSTPIKEKFTPSSPDSPKVPETRAPTRDPKASPRLLVQASLCLARAPQPYQHEYDLSLQQGIKMVPHSHEQIPCLLSRKRLSTETELLNGLWMAMQELWKYYRDPPRELLHCLPQPRHLPQILRKKRGNSHQILERAVPYPHQPSPCRLVQKPPRLVMGKRE